MESKKISSVNVVFRWIEKQSRILKILIGVISVISVLVALKLCLGEECHILYLVAEAVHIEGIIALIYKLIKKKTCAGLSLKSQEVTAIYIAVKLFFSFIDPFQQLHMAFGLAKLVPTIWVIYMIRYKMKSTYNKDLDNLALKKLVIPAVVLAIFVNPKTRAPIDAVIWAFGVYLEAIAVMPQLRLIQNAKMVEPFTAHYIFALGVANFLGCAFLIIMLIESNGNYEYFTGSGIPWAVMHSISAMVQTFISVDFCYYYVKSIMAGQFSVLPLPV